MIINTMEHISDESKKIIIEPNDKYTRNYSNFQEFLDNITHVTLSGAENATTEKYGVGMLSSKLISNGNLATNNILREVNFDLVATDKKYGRVYLSTKEEIRNYTENDNIINANKLNYYFDNNIATNKDFGFVKSLPNSQLVNYPQEDVAVTVDNLSFSMDYMIPKMGIATNDNSGLVKISNTEDIKDGKLGNGYAISPREFHNMLSTKTDYGITKFSSDTEFNKLSSDLLSVTTKNIKRFDGTFSDMAMDANKINSSIDSMSTTRTSYITSEINKIIGGYTFRTVKDYIRVGNLVPSIRVGNRGYEYAVPTGQYLNKNSYPELFSVIGYMYGGSGNNFRLPDLRGLFFRHRGIGKFISSHWKYKIYGLYTPTYGMVQKQMLARHRHGGDWNDQSRHGSSFGHSRNLNWFGSRAERFGCQAVYQTDGGEIISKGGIKDYPNPEGMIDSYDRETRPWTFVVNIYMRIK